MARKISAIAVSASSLLREASDPERASQMAAYMKTDMPFYGVTAGHRRAISRLLCTEYQPRDRMDYETAVRTLWHGEHREEKYLAVSYSRSFPRYVTLSSIPMYRTMIVQGAWWDFVDEIAAHLVGCVLRNQRERLTSKMEAWSTDTDMWLRRASIISQLRHKLDTDVSLLDSVCSQNLADQEFFIRKAIGWALREYAKTDPAWVIDYVQRHEPLLAGLTRREATKHLDM